jgi:hypothetical protein
MRKATGVVLFRGEISKYKIGLRSTVTVGDHMSLTRVLFWIRVAAGGLVVNKLYRYNKIDSYLLLDVVFL